jgi:hypothetical protein
MLKKIFPKVFISLLFSVIVFSGFSICVKAQQKKIPKEPFQIVNASTGKPITEVLVIPVYYSFQGISTMLGEGPGGGTYRYYLNKPFIYRTGEPFILKLPKSSGLNAGFLFIGKARILNGVLIVAPKYAPRIVSDLWSTGEGRKLPLKPISDVEWSTLLEKKLNLFVKDSSFAKEDCRFWDLPEKCSLEIKYDENERRVVSSFLQRTKMGTE